MRRIPRPTAPRRSRRSHRSLIAAALRSNGVAVKEVERRMGPRAVGRVVSRRTGRRSAVAAFLLAATLGLVATACGGGSDSSAEGGNREARTVDESGRKLPGTKEFALTEEEFAGHVEKVQALIAECMEEAGFEYVPADVETIERAQSAVRVEPGYTRLDYKKRWGYGVSTRFDNVVKEIELGPQNLRYIEGLSRSEERRVGKECRSRWSPYH